VVLYWFVFTFMFSGGRTGATGDQYIYFLIAGLLPWLGISEGVSRSATSVVENSAIVRRMPLRSELLVIVPNATAMIFECIALTIFVSARLFQGLPLRNLWLLPAALVLQFLLQLGVGLVLAAVYVFFRDVTQILGFALSIAFYLSPILYPVAGRFGKFFFWNPMTPLLGLFRSAMLAAPLPSAASLVYLLTIAGALCSGGLSFFRRAQPSLVDVI
jgi:ABC-type polysaccharide/polyol phosphate export permease